MFRMVCLLLLALLVLPVAAQDDDNQEEEPPLLELLAAVPDTAQARSDMIYYADIAAAETARGLPDVIHREAFSTLEQQGTDSVWLAALPGFGLPSSFVQNLIPAIDALPRLTGIDLFTIDQTIAFGRPPETGIILRGQFDADAMDEALGARDYTQEEADAVTLWCGPDGCESGQEMDMSATAPGNLFGGHLGRSEPLALNDDGTMVFNSPDFEVLTDTIDTYRGNAPSLAHEPTYTAAAEALLAQGTPRAAVFTMSGSVFVEDALLPSDITEARRASLYNLIRRDDPARVPVGQASELIAVGDVVDLEAGTQQGLLMLTFPDQDTAQAVRAEIRRRLEEPIPLLRRDDSLQALVEARDGSLIAPYVTGVGEKPVLVMGISGELVRGSAEGLRSGRLARFWVDLLITRDLLWLY